MALALRSAPGRGCSQPIRRPRAATEGQNTAHRPHGKVHFRAPNEVAQQRLQPFEPHHLCEIRVCLGDAHGESEVPDDGRRVADLSGLSAAFFGKPIDLLDLTSMFPSKKSMP